MAGMATVVPMWVYFEILPAKSAEMGRQLLGEYEGEVVLDGAKAYESPPSSSAGGLIASRTKARRMLRNPWPQTWILSLACRLRTTIPVLQRTSRWTVAPDTPVRVRILRTGSPWA